MTLLSRHDSPADLAGLADGHAQWHRYLDQLLDGAVANLRQVVLVQPPGTLQAPQFFNPARTDPGACLRQDLVWNAFPGRLLKRFGRDKALVVADRLWPRDAPGDFDPLSPVPRSGLAADPSVRPQDEYCEWRVERDPATQRIQRVVFTAETPEHWTALHGGQMPLLTGSAGGPFDFQGDPQLAARLHADLLGQAVDAADLRTVQGGYDPSNRWNTTHGIVHLTHPANTLCAALDLVAGSTIACLGPDKRPITLPEALCSSLPIGDPNRHSDVAIVAGVNALARGGAHLTLANPVGICIDDVDTSGWVLPGVADPRRCLHIVRGAPGQVLRLVVQAPAGSGALLDDLRIAGEPLLHGGQIAECITVRCTLRCTAPRPGHLPAAIAPARQAGIPDSNRRLLAAQEIQPGRPAGLTPGLIAAFDQP